MIALRLALVSACFSLLGTSPKAQETLYGKQPPPGSAFVRFVNATPNPIAVDASFHLELQLGATEPSRVAPYTVVEKAGTHPFTVNAKGQGHETRIDYKAAPGSYVTLAVGQDSKGALSITPIVDHAEFNQARARLAFYNIAPSCTSAALTLDPTGPVVFQDVATGTTKSRTINPVQAMVQASCADKPGPSLMLSGVEAGSSYSIWLIQSGTEMTLSMTPDISSKYKPKR